MLSIFRLLSKVMQFLAKNYRTHPNRCLEKKRTHNRFTYSVPWSKGSKNKQTKYSGCTKYGTVQFWRKRVKFSRFFWDKSDKNNYFLFYLLNYRLFTNLISLLVQFRSNLTNVENSLICHFGDFRSNKGKFPYLEYPLYDLKRCSLQKTRLLLVKKFSSMEMGSIFCRASKRWTIYR